MKKELGMTTALAAILVMTTQCAPDSDWDEDAIADRDTVICVDEEGRRVAEYRCDDDRRSFGGAYAFFYLRRGGRIPYYDESVRNSRFAQYGSFARTPGVNYASAPLSTQVTRSTARSRGGLGSSGRRFSGSGS